MANDLDALVITDAVNDSQRRVLDRVVSRVNGGLIGWNNTKIRTYTPEECREIVELSKGFRSKDEFIDALNKVKEGIDVSELISYSKNTNLRMYERLSRGENIGEVLWDAFQDSLLSKDSFEGSLNYAVLMQDESRKEGYCNVLEVLFNNQVVSADFGAPGKMSYHLVGRGFVAEGCRLPLVTQEGKQTEKSGILFPLVLYSGIEEQEACADELVNHEIVGHMILRRPDHSVRDVSSKDCIMSVPDNRKEFVDLAMQYRGLKFCGECDVAYQRYLKS